MDAPQDLPTLAELAQRAIQEQNARRPVKVYPTNLGTTRAEGILSEPCVGVAVIPLRAGEEFEWHQHRYEAETLLCFEGEAEARTDHGEAVRLIPGIPYLVDPGVGHSVVGIFDSRLLAIAVPRAEGFPDDAEG